MTFFQIMNILAACIALFVGVALGIGFGAVQGAARRQYEKRQESGDLPSGWSIMPGSGARVAYLLVALLVVQLVCPLLFRNGIQWWVSAGVAGGYGLMLYRQMRQRLSGSR